ncbi:DNA repair protein RadA [Candidatus Woesebacteria bacterium]|nr:DNA repair protein RadA [Candidatus Woesebacteria bacterium]
MYICSECGEGSTKWLGKCPSCGNWNTFVKHEMGGKGSKRKKTRVSFATERLSKAKELDTMRMPTGMPEFDRVLGGGLVKGEVVLLSGPPGIGKSTLLLQGIHKHTTLYISGEESSAQVKHRAQRLGVDLASIVFSETTQLESIVQGIAELQNKPDVVVVDSIQTIYSLDVESTPGSLAQIREVCNQLTQLAKKHHIPIIIVGHVTKDGDVAGPKTLEHIVDAVLTFEGERVSHLRVLRAKKNRFGSTDEIGVFEMKKDGLQPVADPLAFIGETGDIKTAGRAVVGIMEGQRPFFFEVQALAVQSNLAVPRRVVKGVHYNKVLLLLAVLQKHVRLKFGMYDVYVNVVGGVDVKSPAADLGIAAALISSVKDIPLARSTVFTGEIGLLGEVRKGFRQGKIEQEAKRLKFKTMLSAQNVSSVKDLMKKLQ